MSHSSHHSYLALSDEGAPEPAARGSAYLSGALAVAMVERAQDAMLVLDGEDLIRHANPAAGHLFGRPTTQLVGSHFGFPSATTTKPQPIEIRRPDGTRRYAEMRAAALAADELPLNATDAAGARVAILRDVTEQTVLQEQLQHAHKMETVGRVAGGVAHDFNNLLTLIVGHCDLALEDAAGTAAGESVAQIKDAVDNAFSLTRQMLSLSRRHNLEPASVDLPKLLNRLRPLLAGHLGELARLELDLPKAALPPAWVDPAQLEQMVVNLVMNAHDAIEERRRNESEPPTGEVTLMVRSHRTCPVPEIKGGSLTLSVVDNGSGMSRDVQQRALEPFFTTKSGDKGTGLGLVTVQSVLRQGGGALSFESDPAWGTRFDIHLPLAGDAPDVAAPAPADEPVTPIKVLVVEDRHEVRRLTCKLLSRSGFQTADAEDGLTALKLIETARPDVLLTDVVMPGLSGPEVARRALQARPDLRVVFMSGFTDGRLGDLGPELQDAVFLQKPFDTKRLLKALAAV
jgi:two-component system cell cycle sensor histidine kinase/response regulator CckA